jgi:para-aminobenzoate synthetase component 1
MAVVRSTDDGILISWRDGQEEKRVGESLHLLEDLIAEYKLPANADFPDFQGGAAGFISYDYARKIENLPNLAEDDLQIPDLYFYLFDEWAVFDVVEEQVHLMKLSSSNVDLEQRARDWQHAVESGLKSQMFAAGAATDVVHDVTKLQVSLSSDVFEEAVRKVQNYIAQGDVFQVNLSVRQAKELGAEPMQMYEALRSFNPSPYMAFIHSPEFAVVSGSPELLVKKKGQELSTRPIAGTRPRGKDVVEDERLAQELIDNEKERAEHVMLVDLERNDLGRVSKYGTVEVNEFMVIERYSHVMHIVSNVRGIVDENCSNADVVRALFPGGTITGAPKIRTMEIIEELETVRRGLYTGSIGWLGYNGDLELNIVIRTAFIKEEMAYIQAGAGIVIDSIPANEYIESLNKAKALWQAKAMAEECNV